MILKRIFKNVFSGIVFICAVNNELSAQGRTITQENQQWLQYYTESKLNNNWAVLADASYRWRHTFDEKSQYIVRAGLGYTIKPNLKVSAGFAYSNFYTQDTLNRFEYRPHQEIVYTSGKNVKFNQRIRVEERFFNTINDPNSTFNFRFRYSFAVSIPLFKLSKNNPESLFLIRLSDEIFINAGKEAPTKTFDQNRFMVSPTFQLNKNFSISPTWNSQYASTATSGDYRQTHVFWLQVRHNFDFSKKQ